MYPALKIIFFFVFTTVYAFLELTWLDPVVNSDYTQVIFNLFPYHTYIMLPIFVCAAAFLSFDIGKLRSISFSTKKRKIVICITLVILKMAIVFPLLVIVEDSTYFVLDGKPIQENSWTCTHFGCFEAGFTWIPLWYVYGSFLSIFLTFIYRIVERRVK